MKTASHNAVFALALILTSSSATFGGQTDSLIGRGAEATVSELAQGTGYGQITFINSTKSSTLDFYVNGQYQGRALPGLTYTAQVKAGPVELYAVDAYNPKLNASDSGDLEEGASGSWTVSEF
jgi:hypothetical protein